MKLLLLLCLGLTLVCADHRGNSDVVTKNFNMSKISGEWYSILLVSDVKEKIEENGSMRLFVNSIQVLENCSLSLIFHKKVDGECTKVSFICDKIEDVGACSIDYDGCNKFQITETDYDQYLIVYILNRKNDKEMEVMALCARKPDVRPRFRGRFRELCQEKDIPETNILDLTKVDRCLQARGSQCGEGSQC